MGNVITFRRLHIDQLDLVGSNVRPVADPRIIEILKAVVAGKIGTPAPFAITTFRALQVDDEDGSAD